MSKEKSSRLFGAGEFNYQSVNQIKNKIIYKGGTKMSMKKFTKKMLAIVAAGAMTMGMAMPAMAADQTTTDTKNNDKGSLYQQDLQH